jgi:hypothetical protein
MVKILFSLFSILFFSSFGYAQNYKVTKTVVDKRSKLPLEYVTIFNSVDNSTTNQEGLFVFVSNKNELNFSLLGYNTIQTNFESIEKKDTIFMESKAFELNEVVVANLEPFIKKVYDKMADNYASNYTSNFFLRNVLKKDESIVVLQDIHAKRRRDAGAKNANMIQVLNMRKTSFFEKKNQIDFKFPDLNEFYNIFYPALDKNVFTEEGYIDNDYRKIVFEAKEKNSRGQQPKGYFVVNRNDYAIVEFFITMCDDPQAVPYTKFTLSSTHYRTTKYERLMRFRKDSSLNKYYLQLSKLNALVEVVPSKTEDSTFDFHLTMDYFTTNAINNDLIQSNFAVDKDVFKAKFPYSAEFWNNQNQLPLTTELKDFLKRVSENKDKKKQFEIIGNF